MTDVKQSTVAQLRALSQASMRERGWAGVSAAIELGEMLAALRAAGGYQEMLSVAAKAGLSKGGVWRREKMAEHRATLEAERPESFDAALATVELLEAKRKLGLPPASDGQAPAPTPAPDLPAHLAAIVGRLVDLHASRSWRALATALEAGELVIEARRIRGKGADAVLAESTGINSGTLWRLRKMAEHRAAVEAAGCRTQDEALAVVNAAEPHLVARPRRGGAGSAPPVAVKVRVPAPAGAPSSPAPGLGDALRRGFSAFATRYDRALASLAGTAPRRRSRYDDLVTSWEEATAGEREAFLTYLDMERRRREAA